MHFRVTMMVCDLVASTTIMQKHKRMPAVTLQMKSGELRVDTDTPIACGESKVV